MDSRLMGVAGPVALTIGVLLLLGCGSDDSTDAALEAQAEAEAIVRCEMLARGELPDEFDETASIDDLIDRERDRCRELGIDLPPVGSGAGDDAASGGAGSADESDGTQPSEGGVQDDTTLDDEGLDDERRDDDSDGDDRDAGAVPDGTLTELASVYCDIRTELESYPTGPPQPVEDRLEAASLELFSALEAIGSGLTDPAFQAEAHQICPEWVPDPTE